jgi:hypothetical protein
MKFSFFILLHNSLNSIRIFLEYFSVKVGIEDIFNPTTGNESLYEIINDNGVRVVNFATSKNVTVKGKCSHIVTFITLVERLLMERFAIELTKC